MTALQLRRSALPRPLVLVFAIGSTALIAYTFTRHEGMYSGDESIKLAQSIALLEGQVALTYPGGALDPEKHHFPHGPPYAVIEKGEFYGVYSPMFTAPTAVTWAACGYWGLYMLPVLGGIMMLWYTLRLAHRIAPGAMGAMGDGAMGDGAMGAVGDGAMDGASARQDRATRGRSRREVEVCGVWGLAGASAAVLVTTPAILNAAIFNEHALAGGLVAFALFHGAEVGMGRRRWWLVASGAAASLAVALRPELVTGIVALVVFFVTSAEDGVRGAGRRLGWMVVGGIAPLTAYVVVNLVTVGVPSPMLHATYVPLPEPAWGLDIVPAETVALTGVVPVWLVVPLVVALVPRRFARAGGVVLALAAAAWIVVDVIYLYRVTSDDFLHPAALLAATPLFVLGLAHGPYADEEEGGRQGRALWWFAVVGIGAMMAINTSMGHGARIGARFILVYMPALAIVSLIVAKRSRLLQGVAIAAIAVGLWAQVLESRQLGRARGRSAAVVAALRSRPELHVFSGLAWGPQVAGPAWNEKLIFNSDGAMGPLLMEIKRQGYSTVLELVGGLEQWQQLRRRPFVVRVPIDLGTPRVRVYRIE